MRNITEITFPAGTFIITTEAYEALVRASERLNIIAEMHLKLDVFDFKKFVELFMKPIEIEDESQLEPANE